MNSLKRTAQIQTSKFRVSFLAWSQIFCWCTITCIIHILPCSFLTWDTAFQPLTSSMPLRNATRYARLWRYMYMYFQRRAHVGFVGSTFALPKLPGLFCKRALSKRALVQKTLGNQIAPCEMSGDSREDTLYMSVNQFSTTCTRQYICEGVMSRKDDWCCIWMRHVTQEWVMSRVNESCQDIYIFIDI